MNIMGFKDVISKMGVAVKVATTVVASMVVHSPALPPENGNTTVDLRNQVVIEQPLQQPAPLRETQHGEDSKIRLYGEYIDTKKREKGEKYKLVYNDKVIELDEFELESLEEALSKYNSGIDMGNGKYRHLPKDVSGTWVGEKGNSYFIPNNDELQRICIENGSVVEMNGTTYGAVEYKEGVIQLDKFAVDLGGKKMIGDIPNPSSTRTGNAREAHNLDPVEAKKTENGGMINSEYSKSNWNKPKLYTDGTPAQNEAILLESNARKGGQFAIEGLGSAPNYGQAMASMASDHHMAQKHVKDLLDISKEGHTEDNLAKLKEISEQTGLDYNQLVDVTSEPLTLHEQIVTDDQGRTYGVGMFVNRDFHEAFPHSGLRSEAKKRESMDPFKELDALDEGETPWEDAKRADEQVINDLNKDIAVPNNANGPADLDRIDRGESLTARENGTGEVQAISSKNSNIHSM